MTRVQQAITHLQDFVEEYCRVFQIPGAAVAVTDCERLLAHILYGFADKDAEAPVTELTLFEIGSISKSFTAIALLQMQEEGLVNLEQPIGKYLPWFNVRSKYEPISLHHLLSHTAGIIRGTDFTTESTFEAWALRDTQTSAPPGEFFHYSNLGYKVLGLVIERLMDRPYGEIIQQRILDPLGMTASHPVITHETRRNLAVGYRPLYDDRPPHSSYPLVPATWLETASSDGSIASNASDMAAYLRMLLRRGQAPERRILQEESFQLMTQPWIEALDERHGTFYGYGLNIEQVDGHTRTHHGGGMVGYVSAILADLDEGLAVVVLTNVSDNLTEPEDLARYALRVVCAVQRDQDLPAPPKLHEQDKVVKAGEYVGTYSADGRSFQLLEESERLIMEYAGKRIALERRSPDCFYVPHQDFSLFLLRFQRHDGVVTQAYHGADWYINDRYQGSSRFEFPEEWVAYVGHFRSHNPWYPNFRVVLRKNELVLIMPDGDEQPLVPLDDGNFRISEDPRSPERLHFDTMADGKMIRANLSGCDYFRTFTP
jgi:D-alanyl-D-alanine carboxypeptidase